MILMMIFLCVLLYIVLACGLLWLVYKVTSKRILRGLAIVFFLLLPTWDVLLGYAAYHMACGFVPKTEIYETAETDSIYYEGMHDSRRRGERRDKETAEEELNSVGLLGNVLAKGYLYAESLVLKERKGLSPRTTEIDPVLYRCLPLPRDESRPHYQRTSCFIVNGAKSRYMVKVRTYKVGTTEIGLKKIIDRDTGKLMAEYNRVIRSTYLGLLTLPFFNWLEWADGRQYVASCPSGDILSYEQFEYQVLKPKR